MQGSRLFKRVMVLKTKEWSGTLVITIYQPNQKKTFDKPSYIDLPGGKNVGLLNTEKGQLLGFW